MSALPTPRPRRRTPPASLLMLATLAASAACGGSNPTGPGGGSSNMSATIDGQAWASSSQYLQAGLNQSAPGHFPVYGARGTTAADLVGITLNLTSIPGPGTYPLGTAGNVAGGIANVNVGSSVWATPLSGDAGTVTITSVGNGRIAGTFQFTAEPLTGGTGTKTITNGQFNVAITSSGGLQTYDPALLGTGSVVLGGTPWKAATWTASVNQGGLVVILANKDYGISVSVAPFNGAGTYTLAFTPFHRITLTPGGNSSAPCCWGGRTSLVGGQTVLNDQGTITITSVNGKRIQGTFAGTLAPGLVGNQTTNLAVTGGVFDVVIP